jgi:hypothetical protein
MPGIAAHPRALGDATHQLARLVGLGHLAIGDTLGGPLAVIEDGAHEVVGHTHAVIGVLEEHRRVGGAGERAVVAGVDQRPGLPLFLDLAVDELHDVGCSALRITIFAARRVLPPDLITPAKAS